MKEYLATLNDAAFGAATEVQPKFVSPSDLAAQWTGALKGPAFFAYADNYLIDVQCGVIVDVEASRAIRQAEVGAARTMLPGGEEVDDDGPGQCRRRDLLSRCSSTAPGAISSPDAVRRRRSEGSLAASTNARATLLARMPVQKASSALDTIASASRRGSRTSSVSCGSVAFGCEVRAAPRMSSR